MNRYDMDPKNILLMVQNNFESSEMTIALAAIFKGPVQRVLLIAPPEVDADLFVYETGARGRYTNVPPYGLAVLAAHLRKSGIEVDILNLNHVVLTACRVAGAREHFDFNLAWKSALADRLRAFAPQFVGVTSMFSPSHRALVQICEEVRRLVPEVPLAVGGVHITLSMARPESAKLMLKSLQMVDLFFVHECEVALANFFEVINRSASLDILAQVYVRHESDLLYVGRREVPSVDILGVMPAHDLINPTEIRSVGTIGGFTCHLAPNVRQTVAQANRGCRAQCSFCGVRGINGKGVRRRGVESVLNELQMLRDEFGVTHITWLDDDFLYQQDESMALFNGMVQRNLQMTWDCSNGLIAASCTEEIVSAAAAAGCIGVILGLESGSPRILRQIRKPGTVEKYLQAAEIFRQHEAIDVRGFLMLGFPDETFEEIMQTFKLGMQMGLNWYNVSTVIPVPGTPIFDSMLAAGTLPQIDFKELRLRSGPYARHPAAERAARDPLAANFKDAFTGKDLQSIPTAQDLDDIWAYMQYHLNFRRSINETSTLKTEQRMRYLQTITDLIAPENAIALYCLGTMQKRTRGACDRALVTRLVSHLEAQPYWKDRFEDFSLSIDDLLNTDSKDVLSAADGEPVIRARIYS